MLDLLLFFSSFIFVLGIFKEMVVLIPYQYLVAPSIFLWLFISKFCYVHLLLCKSIFFSLIIFIF
jgi:hypothetical protein